MDRGALGPLPTTPICPECLARLVRTNGSDRIHLELWLGKRANARFAKPRLQMKVRGRSYTLGLESYTQVDRWRADTAVQIATVPLPEGIDIEAAYDASFILEAMVIQSGKRIAGIEPSVLRLE